MHTLTLFSRSHLDNTMLASQILRARGINNIERKTDIRTQQPRTSMQHECRRMCLAELRASQKWETLRGSALERERATTTSGCCFSSSYPMYIVRWLAGAHFLRCSRACAPYIIWDLISRPASCVGESWYFSKHISIFCRLHECRELTDVTKIL